MFKKEIISLAINNKLYLKDYKREKLYLKNYLKVYIIKLILFKIFKNLLNFFFIIIL